MGDLTLALSELSHHVHEMGYGSPLRVLSDGEVRNFSSDFAGLEEEFGKNRCVSGLQNLHFKREFIWRMATHPKVLRAARSVIGNDVLLGDTRFFVKYPGPTRTEHFLWHQDAPFWGISPPHAYTCSIALDESSPASGCVRVIPRSHRNGIVAHRPGNSPGNLLRRSQQIPDELIAEDSAVDLALRPGEMSMHHACTFHASGRNISENRRCLLAVVFIPTSVRHGREFAVTDGFENVKWRRRKVVVVSGTDRHGNFDTVSRPFPLENADE